jgi:hypothetical protein
MHKVKKAKGNKPVKVTEKQMRSSVHKPTRPAAAKTTPRRKSP